jgi:putative FmdB family regulatory protein
MNPAILPPGVFAAAIAGRAGSWRQTQTALGTKLFLEKPVPVYTYQCQNCNRRFSLRLNYDDYDNSPVQCKHCGSDRTRRVIGRIRVARSEESRLDSLADPANLDGLEDDPRALGRMMRQMSSEMGEEMGPEFDEVIDRLESGQSPEEIEDALPGLADDLGGGGGFPDPDF